MNLPVTLPDWMPWWLALLILLPACLYALALLAMPFSVLGLKSRLASVEARLDEIQGEIRSLALRLPEPVLRGGMEAPRREDPPPVPPRTAPLRASLERSERPRRPGWEDPGMDEPAQAQAHTQAQAQAQIRAQEQEPPWMMSPPVPPVDKPRPNLPPITKRPSYPSVTRPAAQAAGEPAEEPASDEGAPRGQPTLPPSWLRARTQAGPPPMPSVTPLPPSAEPSPMRTMVPPPPAEPPPSPDLPAADDSLSAPPPPSRAQQQARRPVRPLVRAERRDPDDEGRTVRSEPRIDWPR